MAKIEKILSKMRNNPNGDWRIEDIKKVADRYDIVYRQPGTSHVTFRASNGDKLTVPAHKPIKAIYIKLFLEFIDNLGGGHE